MEKEKFVLITGGGKGLGKEFVIKCAQRGYNVIILSLPGEGLASLSYQIALEYQVKAIFYEIDVTDELLLKDTLREINEKYAVFFLINNAGMGGTAAILQSSLEYMDSIIRLNVRATVMITKLLLPNLIAQKKSYIMNIASMAAFTPIAYKTVYPASKAFISSFSLGLKEELKEQGVSVSIVYPGAIMTNYNVSGRILAQGKLGRLGLLNIGNIAEVSIKKTLQRRSKIIPGRWNRLTGLILNLIPTNTKLHFVSSSVKKELQFNF